MTRAAIDACARAAASLLLACAACYAVLAPFAAPASAEQRAPEKRARVAIDNFGMLAGARRFDPLQTVVPGIIAAVLLPNEHLVMISPEALSGLRDRWSTPGAIGPSGGTAGLEGNVDYLVRGTYLEIQGRIVLSATLEAVGTDREIKLPQVTVDQRRLVAGAESLAASVLAALRKEGVGGRIRYFAVTCFDDVSAVPGATTTRARRELAQYLAGHIGALEGTGVVGWSQVEEFCDQPAPLATVATRLDADVVIGGEISLRDDGLHVVPALHVRETKSTYKIPEVKGPVTGYLQLKADLGDRVLAVLEGAWVDGQWRMAEFSRKLSPEDDLQRGKSLLEKGELALAALHLERAVQSRSGAALDAHLYLGMIQIDQRKYSEAAANLERYTLLRKNSAAGRRELGLAYAGLRRYDAALEQYRKVIDLEPAFRGVRVDMGNAYFYLGRFKEAGQQYELELKGAPGDLAALFNLGLVAERLGDADGAIRAYKRVLGVDFGHEGARRALANLLETQATDAYDRERDYARAISRFTEAIEYWPTARGYFGRGLSRAYQALQAGSPDYASSVSDYEQSVQRSEGVAVDADYHRWALLNLAEAYILTRRFAEALGTARRAEKETRGHRRDHPLSLYLLVVAQLLNGEDPAADLAVLRREVKEAKERIGGWDFSMLDGFYASLEEAKRRAVVEITEEFKKTAMTASR